MSSLKIIIIIIIIKGSSEHNGAEFVFDLFL